MNSVRLTPEAIEDLNNLSHYISEVLINPSAASNTIEGIFQNLRILEKYPEAGGSLEAKTSYKADLRYLICGNYIAIYRIENQFVSVARIFNSKQDFIRVLFG